jgi:hypothetical protein
MNVDFVGADRCNIPARELAMSESPFGCPDRREAVAALTISRAELDAALSIIEGASAEEANHCRGSCHGQPSDCNANQRDM